MAIKTVKVGSLRALHRHLSAVLDEVDGKVPAEDIDLTSTERGGQKPTVDSAPVRSMSEVFPEMRGRDPLSADDLNRINRRR